jgi:GLPGLI family protein
MKYILIALVSQALTLQAQEKFIFEGKIEYERKINLHRQTDVEEQTSDWFKEFVKKSPVFHTSTFSLVFKDNKTIYKPAGEIAPVQMYWLLGPAKDNVIFNDLNKNQRQSNKNIFEKNYLVADSIKQPEWRISDEKRTIAGIECRKAVTVICDSVYVVAFYAEEIPVSSGPESFGGLPGMILGLAVPRLHTTWFATNIKLVEPLPADFLIKTKAQKTDSNKLMSVLKSSMEDWGKFGNRNIWWALL